VGGGGNKGKEGPMSTKSPLRVAFSAYKGENRGSVSSHNGGKKKYRKGKREARSTKQGKSMVIGEQSETGKNECVAQGCRE